MKGQRLQSIVFALALLLIGNLATACTSTVSKSEQLSLGAGQYFTIPVKLKTNDLIEGSFTISGPENLDIGFAIQDPQGRNVLGPVLKRSYNFTYRAAQDGTHHLYIDNTYSLFIGKAVSLTYKHPRR